MYIPKGVPSLIGLSEDAMFERAMQNLKAKVPSVSIEFEDGIGFVDRTALGGMASQLIFHPDFWVSLSKRMGDNLFIHVAQHNEIIICKRSDTEAIFNIMNGIATGELDALLSGTFFVCDDGGCRAISSRPATGG